MPQSYYIAAENKLSEAIIKYMYEIYNFIDLRHGAAIFVGDCAWADIL